MLTRGEIERAFDGAEPLTVGIEDELMLCDPRTLDLTPAAGDVIDLVGGDPRFKRELPAAQIEIVTAPHRTVPGVATELARSRDELANALNGAVAVAGAGAHPFAPVEGELNRSDRYDATAAEYGRYARRQLVFALQVHVAPGSADRALAVYNALRSYLPEIAALAANAPFHDGADTGLASVRPKLAEQLPRQGVPPPLRDWGEYAEAIDWAKRAGAVTGPANWWWELRPHPRFGTLEFRVPDAQTTVAEAAAVVALCQCLVAWLGRRYEDGDELDVAASWRIAENRWWAARDGVDAQLADLRTGERLPVRERLTALLAELAPFARDLGCAAELAAAEDLLDENGALRQRRIAATDGLDGVVRWLAERFTAS
jgi:carboxylate-amine ligase